MHPGCGNIPGSTAHSPSWIQVNTQAQNPHSNWNDGVVCEVPTELRPQCFRFLRPPSQGCIFASSEQKQLFLLNVFVSCGNSSTKSANVDFDFFQCLFALEGRKEESNVSSYSGAVNSSLFWAGNVSCSKSSHVRCSILQILFWFPLVSPLSKIHFVSFGIPCKIRKCGIWQTALTLGVHLWLGKMGRGAIPFPVRNCVDCVAFKRLKTCSTMKLPCACVCVWSALLHTFIWLGLPRWLIVWWCACSKTMTARTFRGRQIYTCNRGVWVKEGASADLIDPNNSKVASYKSNYNPNTRRSTLSWTLVNSAGVAGESGAPTCGITGTSTIPSGVALIDHRHSCFVNDTREFDRHSYPRNEWQLLTLWRVFPNHLECFLMNLIWSVIPQLERGKRVFVKPKELALCLVTSPNLSWHYF